MRRGTGACVGLKWAAKEGWGAWVGGGGTPWAGTQPATKAAPASRPGSRFCASSRGAHGRGGFECDGAALGSHEIDRGWVSCWSLQSRRTAFLVCARELLSHEAFWSRKDEASASRAGNTASLPANALRVLTCSVSCTKLLPPVLHF